MLFKDRADCSDCCELARLCKVACRMESIAAASCSIPVVCWRVLAAILPLAAVACSSGNKSRPLDPSYAALVEPATREPTDDVERAILKRLDELEANAEETIDGHVVVAGAPYSAASGRTCRMVTIRASARARESRSRLACVVDSVWAFVPEVLRLPGAEDGAP